MPSSLPQQLSIHAAIIMDGNGRWALRRGLPRSAGHRAGIAAARAIVEAAPESGIGILTLFAFSSDNWKRPSEEVNALMWLLRGYLRAEAARFIESGARLIVIGRRDRLSARLRHEIQRIEHITRDGRRLCVRIAIDYSSRDSIVGASSRCSFYPRASREDFASLLVGKSGAASPEDRARPDEVDLLIRTGGERRLSDFMLWESAYAELVFSDLMWPDFGPEHLRHAVDEFHRRQRRFGGVCEDKANHTGER